MICRKLYLAKIFYLKFLFFVLLVGSQLSCNFTSSNQLGAFPNIILINADDLGFGDLGCYGAIKVNTPRIDQLAVQGRIFTDAHSASAVCSPSRYGLLTGRYPLYRNLWGPVGLMKPLVIDTSLMTLPKLMSEAGYSTACIGKWHLGFGIDSSNYNGSLKPGPLELGFDYYFGIPSVNSGPPFVYVENHQVVGFDPADPLIRKKKSTTQVWPAKGGYNAIGGAEAAHALYKDEEIGTTLKNKAISWINDQQDDNPFFLYFATTNIHHPFTPAPQFKGTSECGRYGDFIHELDWMVGEILDALEKNGISENTLVIFTSDNGGMLNQGGQDAWKAGHKLNGELMGFKFGAWEGGHRIPFIARWPKKIPANTHSDELISHIDLVSTLGAIVHSPSEKTEYSDGTNILSAFIDSNSSINRNHLIISPNNPSHLTVRKGQWVYIPAQDEGGFQGKKIGNHILGGAAAHLLTGHINSDIENGKIKKDAPPAQLYNLAEDPKQTTNVFLQNPDIVKKMEEIVSSYRNRIGPYSDTGWISR